MDAGTGKIEVPEELITFIKTGSMFIIAGHKEPDGDCVGSQLALRSALRRLGKEAIVCSAGPFKRVELNDYSKHFKETPDEEEKLGAKVIIIDCSNKERTGSLQNALEELPCAVIDHHAAVCHPQSTPEAPVFVKSDSPSCTLLIEKLITSLNLELTSEEAELLLFGLCTDTGFFRHLTEKNADVFEAAARMIRKGANPKAAYKIMNGGKSYNSRILIGKILARMESRFNGKLMISHETLEEFNFYGFEGRDSDSLNKMMLSISSVEATAIIRQESIDNCTISLRSIDDIDVSKIASSLGGGGHKNASGLTMKGDIPFVKKILLKAFSEIFI
ncbi:MAG: bifunctional oligoribonuclease/PAP phosphatase NrnA [Treponema sp.]|nr:bifunctional oligoribonuclease/PAP phosphatase NrnA [Treponema sp.]MCL2272956.1 bifunctional oligoribonuclease/PAP phosphatase NrnA [Treponema sp.]